MHYEQLSDILTKQMLAEIAKRGYPITPNVKEDVKENCIPYFIANLNKKIEDNAEFYIEAEKELREPAMDL